MISYLFIMTTSSLSTSIMLFLGSFLFFLTVYNLIFILTFFNLLVRKILPISKTFTLLSFSNIHVLDFLKITFYKPQVPAYGDFQSGRNQLFSGFLKYLREMFFGPNKADIEALEQEIASRNNEMMGYLRPKDILDGNFVLLPNVSGEIVPGHLIYGQKESSGTIHEYFVPLVIPTVRKQSEVIDRGQIGPNSILTTSEVTDLRLVGFSSRPTLNKYLTTIINNETVEFRSKIDCDRLYGYQQYATGDEVWG